MSVDFRSGVLKIYLNSDIFLLDYVIRALQLKLRYSQKFRNMEFVVGEDNYAEHSSCW